MMTILFLGGWLSPIPLPPFTWVPGVIWFVLKVVLRVLHVRDGEGHRAALPLRPADAARLEGVPAACRWSMVVIVAGVLQLTGCVAGRRRASLM